jgi:hypothetical protein
MGILHADQYTISISCLVLCRIRNISDRSCRENENTHFMFSNFFFVTRAINGIMWNNIVGPDRPQMIIWHMYIACWITRSTNMCSEYVMLTDFLLQQWL